MVIGGAGVAGAAATSSRNIDFSTWPEWALYLYLGIHLLMFIVSIIALLFLLKVAIYDEWKEKRKRRRRQKEYQARRDAHMKELANYMITVRPIHLRKIIKE